MTGAVVGFLVGAVVGFALGWDARMRARMNTPATDPQRRYLLALGESEEAAADPALTVEAASARIDELKAARPPRRRSSRKTRRGEGE